MRPRRRRRRPCRGARSGRGALPGPGGGRRRPGPGRSSGPGRPRPSCRRPPARSSRRTPPPRRRRRSGSRPRPAATGSTRPQGRTRPASPAGPAARCSPRPACRRLPGRGPAWPAAAARRPTAAHHGTAAAGCGQSSGPAFLPSASRTAVTAAAHSGVRSPRITPAPANVVSTCRNRSGNAALVVLVGMVGLPLRQRVRGDRGQVVERRARRGGLGEDLLGAVAELLGQLLQPADDLPRPGVGDLPLPPCPAPAAGAWRCTCICRTAAFASFLLSLPSRPARREEVAYPSASCPSWASNRNRNSACATRELGLNLPHATPAPHPAPQAPAQPHPRIQVVRAREPHPQRLRHATEARTTGTPSAVHTVNTPLRIAASMPAFHGTATPSQNKGCRARRGSCCRLHAASPVAHLQYTGYLNVFQYMLPKIFFDFISLSVQNRDVQFHLGYTRPS